MRNMPAAAFLHITHFPKNCGLYSLPADTLRDLIAQASYDHLHSIAKTLEWKQIDVSAAIGVTQIVSAIIKERALRLKQDCYNERRRLTIEWENSDGYGLWQTATALDNHCRYLIIAYERLTRWHAISVQNEWIDKLRAALLAQIED